MATLKVGQKVRIVSTFDADGRGWSETPVGAEGTIVRRAPFLTGWQWVIQTPSAVEHVVGQEVADDEWFADSCMLAPLTDPGADAFMERIKKLKPYDEPKVSVTTEHGTALFPK